MGFDHHVDELGDVIFEIERAKDEAWHLRLLEQSVVVPGPVTGRLGAAARAAGVHLVRA